MQKNLKKYFIGLDLGTNSVGWAVLNEDFSLMKKSGKHMWGSRLFEDAKTSAETRTLRQSRRRYERRKERIRLLQMLLAQSVSEVDSSFFSRMEKSFLLNEKKDPEFGRKNIYNLFDGVYTDKDYYKQFKTIYHLRERLCKDKIKYDIRFVYLALHHIIKYRGNFLHDGDFSVDKDGVKGCLSSFVKKYNEEVFVNEDGELYNILQDVDLGEVSEILCDFKEKKAKKKEKLSSMWADKSYMKRADELVKLLLGYQADFGILFDIDAGDEEGNKKIKYSFSSDDYEEKRLSFDSDFGSEIVELIDILYSAYQDCVLRGVLGENNTLISEGMVAVYEKHAKDLKILKNLLKDYPDVYKKVFKNEDRISYTGYIKNDRQSSNRVSTYKPLKREDFYKKIKDILNVVPDCENKTYVLDEIEKDYFLPKINSSNNSVIPYQLNLAELELILKNQSEFYPELKANSEKIKSILTFKRPYSVGVINTKSKFSWLDEDMVANERVYPWNFEELVDIERAGENFIKNLTNRCRFFLDEYVLPLNSPIYQKYVVLNELNKIKIADKKEFKERNLTVEEKQAVFNKIFLKQSTVRGEDVRQFLFKEFGIQIEKGGISGLSDTEGKKFLSKMSAWITLKGILSQEQFANADLLEKIVEVLTVFSDKKIRRSVLSKLGLADEVLYRLAGLNFSGWGSFSKKLLTQIKSYNGECILDILYNTNKNFNEIIYSEEYGFKEQLFVKDDQKLKPVYSSVKDLYLSPSVKRTVWQAVKIVREIVKIQGCAPQGIYVESTRKDDKKTKSLTRKEKLKELFKNVERETSYYNCAVQQEINRADDQKLRDDMIYLYLLQMGKSMYSGKPLGGIDELSLNCEIDHIIPQFYVKDDSLENRVLVLKQENQKKSSSLTLLKDIREDMQGFWRYLLKNGLMGKKKYQSLMRAEFTDKDEQSFINRQLVETNQSIKAVRDLFKHMYPESDVELIKSGISTEFRKTQVKEGNFSFIKLRDLNDFHHAKDAYLACAIARFTRKIYPIWGADSQARLLKDDMYSTKSGVDIVGIVNDRNGIVVDAMRLGKVDSIMLSSGESIDWNTCYNNILKTFDYNDCLVTRQTEITAESAFYDGYIYGANDNSVKGGISLRYAVANDGEKKPLPIHYGRYTGRKSQYFLNVTYLKGKKKETKLMGVPVQIAYKAKCDKQAIYDYFKLDLESDKKRLVSVDYNPVRKYQPIIFNGQFCYITSDSYLISGVQLVVDKKYYPLLYSVTHPEKKVVYGKGIGEKCYKNDKEYFEPIIKEFVLYYCEKVKKLYPLLGDKPETIIHYINSDEFDMLPYYDLEVNDEKKRKDKSVFLRRLLQLTAAKSVQLDMKAYGGALGWGMLNGKKIAKEDVVWCYQSVTGLYEEKVIIKE